MTAKGARLNLFFTSLLTTICLTTAFDANTAWTTPNGSLGDFGQTYKYNNTIDISWNPLNTSTSDLWIAAWNMQIDNYAERIAQNINISTSGSFTYTFDVPISQLSTNALFVFHFVPVDTNFGPLYFGSAVNSPGFSLLADSNATTTSAAASTTSSNPLIVSSIVVSATGSPTPPPASAIATSQPTASPGPGLSTAAKAGAFVGISFAFILGAFAAFLIARRHRRKHAATASDMYNPEFTEGGATSATSGTTQRTLKQEQANGSADPLILNQTATTMSELPASRRSKTPSIAEMYAGGPLMELPATAYSDLRKSRGRDLLHELPGREGGV